MRHLFVSKGALDGMLIDDMDDARALREDADYRAGFSPTSAQHSLKSARQMVDRVSALLVGWEKEAR